eukprot:GHVT01065419.1.p1 GENE.GHVT01065419.1~~GHVT01065419.1.p1  ORF type:complete len:325 (+),score=28.82 GHVT01065419.1:692-1666(+)
MALREFRVTGISLYRRACGAAPNARQTWLKSISRSSTAIHRRSLFTMPRPVVLDVPQRKPAAGLMEGLWNSPKHLRSVSPLSSFYRIFVERGLAAGSAPCESSVSRFPPTATKPRPFPLSNSAATHQRPVAPQCLPGSKSRGGFPTASCFSASSLDGGSIGVLPFPRHRGWKRGTPRKTFLKPAVAASALSGVGACMSASLLPAGWQAKREFSTWFNAKLRSLTNPQRLRQSQLKLQNALKEQLGRETMERLRVLVRRIVRHEVGRPKGIPGRNKKRQGSFSVRVAAPSVANILPEVCSRAWYLFGCENGSNRNWKRTEKGSRR